MHIGNLRAESIEKQLNGEIPASEEDRTGEGYELVDASDVNVSDMGQQGGAGKMPKTSKAGKVHRR